MSKTVDKQKAKDETSCSEDVAKHGKVKRERRCGYCGREITNNWDYHWVKSHGVRSKSQWKELEP